MLNPNEQFDSLMIDNETMGLGPNAAVMQIGVQSFNSTSGALGQGLLIDVDLNSALMLGGETDPETILWWRQRGGLVQKSPKSMRAALATLAAYVGDYPQLKRVWCRGLSFDLAHLEGYYMRAGVPIPWKYNIGRDTRTIFDLAAEFGWVKLPEHEPVHNGLADARIEVRLLMSALETIRSLRERVLLPNAGELFRVKEPQEVGFNTKVGNSP